MKNSREIIDFFCASKPHITWEIDAETLELCRQLKDHCGKYIWKPSTSGAGTLLDMPVVISKQKSYTLNIRYDFFSDGHSHTIRVPL